METKVIAIPEGYEIDKDKSTDRQIVLKAIEQQRPKTWEEYCKMKEGKPSFYFDDYEICEARYGDGTVQATEFDTEDEVKAYLAFGKIIKLRKAWVGDWQPDWTNDESKYTIINEGNLFVSSLDVAVSSPMSFPTEEMRDEFAETFTDLLEVAKPLL